MSNQVTTKLERVVDVVCESDGRLLLTYADGFKGTVDLSPLIRKGGVFARLADPKEFRRVQVGGGGRYLEWPGEIDLCADALRLQAKETG